MFAWLLKKTDAELLKERIDRIENEVTHVAKERSALEARAASEVAKRRVWQDSLVKIKAMICFFGGLVVSAFVMSTLWDKVILFVSFSLTKLVWFALAAFVAGWLLVYFAWPDPQT